MYLCDAHLHSEFSYDADSKLSDICGSATAAGLSEVCVTDHFDANLIGPGDPPESHFDADAAEKAIKAAAAEYAGRLTVTYGIELGEPHELPDCSRAMLAAHDFDFIIGSLHNAPGDPDYYVVPFDRMDDEEYKKTMDRYFEQNMAMLEFGGFHTLGHLGYPWRLSEGKGHPADPERHRAAIEEIFRFLIKNGVALEVNTSGLRREINTVHPLPVMLEWYRAMGGRLITIGSDAHSAGDVGAGVRETHRLLRKLGFTEFTVFRAGKPEQKKLAQ
ncbi:MAG: histidinol-phosphatase HisJ family protein [Clostridia bacterium]|nr:histidinol-phosphatase HisJ family protein [Clostridia bacterium]